MISTRTNRWQPPKAFGNSYSDQNLQQDEGWIPCCPAPNTVWTTCHYNVVTAAQVISNHCCIGTGRAAGGLAHEELHRPGQHEVHELAPALCDYPSLQCLLYAHTQVGALHYVATPACNACSMLIHRYGFCITGVIPEIAACYAPC